MTIRVNGEERPISAGMTVDTLLGVLEGEGLSVDRRALAVEVNREIVPKSTYASHALADSDEVEIVTIVGGG